MFACVAHKLLMYTYILLMRGHEDESFIPVVTILPAGICTKILNFKDHGSKFHCYHNCYQWMGLSMRLIDGMTRKENSYWLTERINVRIDYYL